MAEGFTRLLLGKPNFIPSDLIEAQETLSAKQNLTRVLQSNRCVDIPLAPGDLVEVVMKCDGDKQGKWLSPHTTICFLQEPHIGIGSVSTYMLLYRANDRFQGVPGYFRSGHSSRICVRILFKNGNEEGVVQVLVKVVINQRYLY